jgi:hypothetical protein
MCIQMYLIELPHLMEYSVQFVQKQRHSFANTHHSIADLPCKRIKVGEA